MKHRHKMHKKAAGGGVTVHGGGNPNVLEEAESKRRAHGGRAKHVEHAKGKHGGMRLDRKGRKHGGRIGADKSPLSSANKDHGGTGVDTRGPFEAPK